MTTITVTCVATFTTRRATAEEIDRAYLTPGTLRVEREGRFYCWAETDRKAVAMIHAEYAAMREFGSTTITQEE